MATSIGTTSQGTFTGPGAGTTVTINNITQDSGSNGYLYVVLQHQNNNTPTVTYNGSSMTKIISYNAQGIFWDIYELASPSTGANDLVFTYTAFQEYGTNISYWTISTTGANGYGNTQTASGAGGSPGVDCDISSISSGSAVVLAATLTSPTLYNQTLTVDGSTVDYDNGGNASPYSQQTGTSNRSTGWYCTGCSTGDTNMISDSLFNMAGVAFEITESGGTPPARRRIIIC